MDEQRLLEAGINYEAGLKRFSGKRELYGRFLSKFPRDENYRDMTEALEAGDWNRAFFHAHTLKGVSGNLSMDQLYTHLVPLVEALRNNRTEEAKALAERVKISYETAVEALKQHREESGA